MNPTKLVSPYLPKKIIYHLKIISVSALLSLVFAWARDEQPALEIFLICFIILVIQLETFLWLASKVLKIKASSVTEGNMVNNTIIRLIVFYLGVLIISVLIVASVLSVSLLLKGENLQIKMQYLMVHEFPEFLKLYILCLILTAIIHFYFLWRAALGREQDLRAQKLQFQYETLKSQVNPHFLFNTLNTLSSLMETDSTLADQFIKKLSAIYHYILEHQEMESVDLITEIDFVRDYFFLQQIRDENKIRLTIEIEDPQNYKIVPISLQLLVENALKHNLATHERPLKIKIHLVNDTIVVQNNLQRKSTLILSKKIGLNNLRQRVEFYTKKEMKVIETKDEFNVIIPLLT